MSQAALAHLRKKIDRLEGVHRRFARTASICGIIDNSLPCNGLPLGGIHEIKGSSLACAIAFASLLAARIPQKGAILYAAPDRLLSPLGLLPYGVKLERWIHVCARRPEDLAWTVLEAIRCPQMSAVLTVMKAADLTFCRRLQLAAESSGATGFLLGNGASSPAGSAITRWRVSSVNGPSGRGFGEAFWDLELLYCRGGRPGKWRVAWRHGVLVPTRPVQRVQLAAEAALAG
jgi:protein ImuA